MRPDGTLETMKQDQERSVVRAVEVMDVEEVAIGRVESLHSCFVKRLTPEKLAP
jgi:hypothetical protein